ncbi:DnaA N-terminal domain-containing protein [Inquilinus limosus]|uniref:DnaA N-terminal domain-containing protein n=1 Tax=Inquilinus limosus TaxID=171674 RepID=UPI0004213A15|nr:DnaA N-terminal domain-containing protein [Inquilinus limosus]
MPRKPPDDPVFDAFWAVYPARRPNPRERARKLFNALIKAGTVTAEELTAAARAYAAERRAAKADPKFNWMASTFLADERWRDYLAAEEAAEAPPTPGVHPFAGLVDRVGIKKWSTWFRPLRLERHGELHIIVAPTRFHADRVRADFEQLLRQLLGEIEVRP